MDWRILVLLTGIFMGIGDFFIKLGGDTKSNPVLLGLIFSIIACIPPTIYFLYIKGNRGGIALTKEGLIYAIVAGVCLGIVHVLFFTVYAKAPVTIVVPAVKVGGLVFVSLLGIIILKDSITLIKALGFIMSIGGIYLLLK